MNTESKSPPDPAEARQSSPIPCEKIQELLFDYLSNELGDKQSWLVHEHLLGCRECSAEAARLEAAVEALKASRPPHIPEHLPPTMRRRLERAILHPVIDWMYCHRRLTAWLAAILGISLIVAAAWASRVKPDFTIYWLK